MHWSRQKEQAAGYWNVKLLHLTFLLFPVAIMRILAFVVSFFYFIFSKRGRSESGRFLKKAAPFIQDPAVAKKCSSPFGPLRHICSFSLYMVEKIQSWGGKFPFKNIHFMDDDIAELNSQLVSGKGVFIICSHLGNMEMLRGLESFGYTLVSRNIPVTTIVDVQVSENFTRVLNELNPQSSLEIISASDIGPHTAILLQEKLSAGEVVAIAGDRTSAGNVDKRFMIPFLGEEAPFSIGPFYLAALMEAPVYFLFALRRKDLSIKPVYDMRVHKCPLSFDCSRKERLNKSSLLACSFAALLESYCKQNPFQWYNFYDFWSKEA